MLVLITRNLEVGSHVKYIPNRNILLIRRWYLWKKSHLSFVIQMRPQESSDVPTLDFEKAIKIIQEYFRGTRTQRTNRQQSALESKRTTPKANQARTTPKPFVCGALECVMLNECKGALWKQCLSELAN